MSTITTPAHILLATDLSSRSDRALDRAVLLARDWQAQLLALTVVEPEPVESRLAVLARASGEAAGTSRRALAERRLRADLAGEGALPLVPRVEQGAVTDTVLTVAAAEGSGLIVTGVARNEALSRVVLGSTVDALARRSPVPLLVVRNRARESYRQVVVASDFSPASRHSLRTAAALFPGATLTLFHAFDNPYPAIGGVDPAQVRADGLARAEREAEAFIRSCELPAEVAQSLRTWLEHGDVGLLLHHHGQANPADLVVLGTRQRGGVLGLLLGSAAQRALEIAENDVLVVPGTAPD
ncbi:universal stress protein [Hydrogenophaga palleronii]|uniref:universal stress protein n=1 Tax=Hydrogenophaga palleronii TaxID=65655 RepID=UPI000825A9E0|nr:universal stress protein [Hydrogenophaga palleronii]